MSSKFEKCTVSGKPNADVQRLGQWAHTTSVIPRHTKQASIQGVRCGSPIPLVGYYFAYKKLKHATVSIAGKGGEVGTTLC